MLTRVPLSDFSRQTTKVTEMAAQADVILSRRGDAEDLLLSTRERYERQTQAQLITTGTLAVLARTRPDLAAEAMTETLPWIAWLPTQDQVSCLQELLDDLRAGAQTGDLRRFALDLEAWQSTAVAYNDPDVLAALKRATVEGPAVPRPTSDD